MREGRQWQHGLSMREGGQWQQRLSEPVDSRSNSSAIYSEGQLMREGRQWLQGRSVREGRQWQQQLPVPNGEARLHQLQSCWGQLVRESSGSRYWQCKKAGSGSSGCRCEKPFRTDNHSCHCLPFRKRQAVAAVVVCARRRSYIMWHNLKELECQNPGFNLELGL